jgi:hypothetical protein
LICRAFVLEIIFPANLFITLATLIKVKEKVRDRFLALFLPSSQGLRELPQNFLPSAAVIAG